MSDLSWPSDTDSEGKPPGWRHWWDKAASSSSDDSPPPASEDEWDDDEEEDGMTTRRRTKRPRSRPRKRPRKRRRSSRGGARRRVWAALFLPVLVLADSFQPRATGCNRNCGGVDIPFPFGIEAGCFLPGFQIHCNDGGAPVLADNTRNLRVLNLTVMPRPEAWVMLPIAYQCYDTTDGAIKSDESFDGNIGISPVYRMSNTRNELVVLGCNTFAYTNSGPWGRSWSSFYTGCVGYCDHDGSAKDGACAGIGCCRVDIPPGLNDSSMTFESTASNSWSHKGMAFSPCDYAFIVAKNTYHFRVSDLKMDGSSVTKPLVLDWAIRDDDATSSGENMTCSGVANKPGYACVSHNSECHDSTNDLGYFCACKDGYKGNPYLVGDSGCQDINECEEKHRCCTCTVTKTGS
ncbi:hypothetical protein QYE76_038702 [Lolium multiflorum]|uniref:Wall-associated receptor kinase galacturonan-binding domain-containing protein n=1 Tax=Lolium multiflorum TaxID=4521 RepID=A0AAD8WRH5_LOLMU|nr:hypothetical protein QYE76_038702 [Lolium multiflorum]